jgi:hypothetical protein
MYIEGQQMRSSGSIYIIRIRAATGGTYLDVVEVVGGHRVRPALRTLNIGIIS